MIALDLTVAFFLLFGPSRLASYSPAIIYRCFHVNTGESLRAMRIYGARLIRILLQSAYLYCIRNDYSQLLHPIDHEYHLHTHISL